MSVALESLMHDEPAVRGKSSVVGSLFGFIAIGGAGAAAFVVLSTLMIGLDTGFADWVVNTACYASLIVPVYLLHRRFSFGSDAPHSQALPRYIAVQAMALVLAAASSYVVHGVPAVPTVLASTLVIALTSGVNFMVLRGWAFAQAQWDLTAPA